jgi:flagellar biogenesis protein FliO
MAVSSVPETKQKPNRLRSGTMLVVLLIALLVFGCIWVAPVFVFISLGILTILALASVAFLPI